MAATTAKAREISVTLRLTTDEVRLVQNMLNLLQAQRALEPQAPEPRVAAISSGLQLALNTGLLKQAEQRGCEEPIHWFFGLTYAQYLAIPRSVLQSMPVEWQRRFVDCLEELDEQIDWRPEEGHCYRVQLCRINEIPRCDDDDGVDYWADVVDDPLADYDRGRRRVASKQRREFQERTA